MQDAEHLRQERPHLEGADLPLEQIHKVLPLRVGQRPEDGKLLPVGETGALQPSLPIL